MNNAPVKTAQENRKPQTNQLKKMLAYVLIGLGCVISFIGAFLIATSFFIPSNSVPVQDGKAIVQKVTSSDSGCEITVRLDGEDIIISDKDPHMCGAFKEGMDITEELLSSN